MPTTFDPVPEGKGLLRELYKDGVLIGAVAGAGVGVWAALVRKVLEEEKDVLIATFGGAVGLLAVTLTAMTLVIVFLNDEVFRVLISGLTVRRFFRPFVVVAVASAGAALFSLFGLLDNRDRSPQWSYATRVLPAEPALRR